LKSSCPGRYTFTVERGKEYFPEEREVIVGEQPVELKFHCAAGLTWRRAAGFAATLTCIAIPLICRT